jgi:hypothetical protein
MKPALQQIHDIAKAVADGYAAEQSMGDDGLYSAVVDLGDHAETIMKMAQTLDAIEKACSEPRSQVIAELVLGVMEEAGYL